MDLTEARLVGLVALGGALGSVVRYGVSGLLTRGDFPWGTFAVNFSGTFLLSLLFFQSLGGGAFSAEARVFLFIGVFGGFTTFSTFGVETVGLVRNSQPLLALANVGLNAGLCLLGAFLGAVVGLWAGGTGHGA